MSFEGPAQPQSPAMLLISVVVIGRNEGERLRRCLASIAAMRRRDFDMEVIYVDSGSRDASLAIAAEAGVKCISLTPERPSAALGRNAGWREAHGGFVLFLDGDTVLHPDFVAMSLPEFVAQETAVVWGHRRELHPDHSLYNRVLDLDWVYLPGPALFCGGDALFRRSVLLQTGGFDETLIAGEEPELCRRIVERGWMILHVDRPMTGHDLAITRWEQYWKRAKRAGHAFAEVADRFRSTENPFWLDVAKGNERRAVLLLLTCVAGVAGSLSFWSCWPTIGTGLALLSLSVRSAWRVRWKCNNKVTLLLYGIHSHLQQLPIYIGQLQYRSSRRRGERLKLIEYNRSR